MKKLLSALALFGAGLCFGEEVELVGKDAPWKGSRATAEVNYVVSNDVLRAEVKERPKNYWGSVFHVPLVQPVEKGDCIVLEFKARCISSENAVKNRGRVRACVQYDVAPHPKLVMDYVNFTDKWETYRFGAVSQHAAPLGTGKMIIFVGEQRQVIEFKDLRAFNFGKGVPANKIPRLRTAYQGIEPNAPWRREADARIEKYRKGDLKLKLTDAKGKPLSDARVEVQMTRHAFPFGTAVQAHLLNLNKPELPDCPAEDIRKYRDTLTNLFNCAVIENALKPHRFKEGYPPGNVDGLRALEFLRKADMKVRGHCAVWPSHHHSPKEWNDLLNKPEKKAQLREMVRKHVEFALRTTKNDCWQWDVMNEPFLHHEYMDFLGKDVMVEWFKAAHQAAPNVQLCINDFGIVEDKAHAEEYVKTIRYLLDNGAPVQAIGEQSHYYAEPPGIDLVFAMVDRLSVFKLPIICTEFDMNTDDEQMQAAFTRDYYTALFSRPEVEGILMWGFWAKRHWSSNAAGFTADWREKPAMTEYRNLVFNKWWTKAAGKASRAGEYQARAFYGDYNITVSTGSKTKTFKVKLSPNDPAPKTLQMID